MNANQLEVEVSLDFDIYRAFVEDVTPYELEVSFDKNWRPPCLIEFKKIRFPPDENVDASFKENQLVEVRRKDRKNQVRCWRKAILRELNSYTGRWSIEYFAPDEENSSSEVPIHRIRHVNERPAIGQFTLEKVEVKIPYHLQEVAATSGIHDDFQKHVSADSCKFISELRVLRLISKNGELTRKKVDLLKNSHIKFLESERKSPSRSDEAPKFTELFEVDEKLMGLALGKKYSNIKEARKIRDITSVKLIDGTLTIEVCGKTAEAVKTARNKLEYREHHSAIPRYLAEELLENDGSIIKEIIEQSGLVRLECGEDDDDVENEDYPIVFVGNPLCIENAKAFLEYQLKLIDRNLKKKETTRSESVILNDPNLIVERIPLKQNLKGLAIGKNFENLRKAENIPGIVKIDAPKEMPMITIHAQNSEAAQAARRLLEYDEDTVEVERYSLGKIIGKGGVTIKQIESSSDGVRVRVPSKVETSDLSINGKVIIKLCGPAHKIPATIELIKRAETYGHL